MQKRIHVILIIALVALMTACPEPPASDSIDVNGTWMLMTIDGTDWSSFQDVYVLDNGTGTYYTDGETTPTGDGFAYTVNGTTVTLDGAFEEYLSDGSYSVSIDGTSMTWDHQYASTYVFELQ